MFFDFHHTSHKLILLYRFHIAVVLVNLFAIIIDLFAQRYNSIIIESSLISLILFNMWSLRSTESLKKSAYIFILLVSLALFSQIYMTHFATMSIIFVLLLPLTTLVFLSLKESLILVLIMFSVMAGLLYLESITNPQNPIIQNPEAIFNLSYTAIILYFFGLLYHVSILRTFDDLDASNHQKALLLKEVHHRVKNNLNVIASILGLQGNSLQGKAKEELLKTKTRIESIALVHEMLYKHEDFKSLEFSSYVKHLSSLLLNMYGSDKDIEVKVSSDVTSMPLDVMVQLGIMVNELITNSIKYAFVSKGIITMELHYKNERYHFVYYDDGIGHKEPELLLKTNSLGVKLIHLTAKQLKGSLKISSDKGLKYEVEFGL